MRVAYTAGEAIGPDLFTFYRSIGINLKQLYGSTETAVFVCLQPDHEVKADTVGVPIDGVEIKVTDSGEILVKSPGLLKEYYKNPAATAEVLTGDGWYHTGDAGFLDAGGHLKIIDRAKDVGRIMGGAQRRRDVRAQVRREQAEVLPVHQGGGGLRRQARARLRVRQHRLRRGGQLGREAQPALCRLHRPGAASPRCYELMRDCVEKVNADLAADDKLAGSQISRFLILHKELDADDGELTRTRKVRRGSIAEKYQVLVDALYGGKSRAVHRDGGEVRGRPQRQRVGHAEDRRRPRRSPR